MKRITKTSIHLVGCAAVKLGYNGACKKRCANEAIHYPGTQPLIKCIEAKSSKIRAMFFTLCYSQVDFLFRPSIRPILK